MLNIESGESVLYVGDHLYSDVLRSKRTLGWRTALIVPELDDEIKAYKEEKEDRNENIPSIQDLLEKYQR